jgi:hypothetical protein
MRQIARSKVQRRPLVMRSIKSTTMSSTSIMFNSNYDSSCSGLYVTATCGQATGPFYGSEKALMTKFLHPLQDLIYTQGTCVYIHICTPSEHDAWLRDPILRDRHAYVCV